jgi:hypothetical protein
VVNLKEILYFVSLYFKSDSSSPTLSSRYFFKASSIKSGLHEEKNCVFYVDSFSYYSRDLHGGIASISSSSAPLTGLACPY